MTASPPVNNQHHFYPLDAVPTASDWLALPRVTMLASVDTFGLQFLRNLNVLDKRQLRVADGKGGFMTYAFGIGRGLVASQAGPELLRFDRAITVGNKEPDGQAIAFAAQALDAALGRRLDVAEYIDEDLAIKVLGPHAASERDSQIQSGVQFLREQALAVSRVAGNSANRSPSDLQERLDTVRGYWQSCKVEPLLEVFGDKSRPVPPHFFTLDLAFHSLLEATERVIADLWVETSAEQNHIVSTTLKALLINEPNGATLSQRDPARQARAANLVNGVLEYRRAYGIKSDTLLGGTPPLARGDDFDDFEAFIETKNQRKQFTLLLTMASGLGLQDSEVTSAGINFGGSRNVGTNQHVEL